MNIIIPVNQNKQDEASITLLDDLKHWAYIEMAEGEMRKCEFFEKRDGIQEYVECLVVKNNKEDVEPFLDENIMVLVAPEQNSIAEIVSAYMFRELHDIHE